MPISHDILLISVLLHLLFLIALSAPVVLQTLQMSSSTPMVLDLLIRYAAASASFRLSEDIAGLRQLADVAQEAMAAAAAQFISEHADVPLLLQYSADTTPLTVKTHVSLESTSSSSKVTGKKKIDVAVQHVSFTALTPGTGSKAVSTSILFREPQEVCHGKSNLSLAGLLQACPGLYMMSTRPKIVSIRHQVFDAGIVRSFGDFVSGSWCQHNVFPIATQDIALAPDDAQQVYSLFEWHTFTHCACHVAHNALKWAVSNDFPDGNLMKTLFILISSARSSYMHMVDSLIPWLQQVLVPWPEDRKPDPELAILWTALGADPDQIELLVHYQLVFEETHNQLRVAPQALKEDTFITTFSGLLLGLWKMEAFSESHWLSLGSSCRGVLRSLLSGFKSCISRSYAHQHKDLTDFNASGFLKNIDGPAAALLGLASLASLVPETFLTSVTKDNRVPPRAPEVQRAMCDDMLFLSELPESVWTTVGSATDAPHHQLKDMVLKASHGALTPHLHPPEVSCSCRGLPLEIGVWPKHRE